MCSIISRAGPVNSGFVVGVNNIFGYKRAVYFLAILFETEPAVFMKPYTFTCIRGAIKPYGVYYCLACVWNRNLKIAVDAEG